MTGLLRFARPLRMRIEPVQFTKNRFSRRWNMVDEDRLKWYNMNLLCIFVTIIPVAYMQQVSYHTSKDTDIILRTLDPIREEQIVYSKKLFGA